MSFTSMFQKLIAKIRLWLFAQRASALFIKVMEQSDAVSGSKIHAQNFERGWTDGELAQLIDDPKNVAIAISRSQRAPICGFIIVRRVESVSESEVLTIAVEKSWQGLGLGRRLLDEAIRSLHSDRIEMLFLEVDENNAQARRLYDKLGFETVGQRKGYYSTSSGSAVTKLSNALVMRLRLG